SRRPFDLAEGPHLRCTLVRLGPREHLLVVVMHHIVADGWSIRVIARDLSALYAARSRGQAPDLPPPRLQYPDYALWQRRWLEGERLPAQLEYWKRQLHGAPPFLELPTDRPRPAVQRSAGKTLRFTVDADLTAQVRALAASEGATLFMGLLAAFSAVLGRWAGRDDVLVGCPIANRHLPGSDELVGVLVNTLVLRTDLSGRPTARELLRRVRETTLGAFAHQDLPFERLVDALQPERSLGRTPLFQVMLSLESDQPEVLELPGLSIRATDLDSGTAKFDLELILREGPGGLDGLVELNTDLFDDETVARLHGHLVALLGEMVARPDRPVRDLSILTARERRHLLHERNATAGEFPADRCAHQLLEEQAARTPDALALRDGSEALGYAQLDRRANGWAIRLAEAGAAPDSVVALLSGRDGALWTAALAVLKASAAYLPLDPKAPAPRLATALEQTGAKVAVVSRALRGRLEEAVQLLPAGRRVSLVELESLPADGPERAPEPRTGPGGLAYVIFTSGSTGTPKGVMVEHRGMVNHLFAKVRDLELTAADAVAQTATQCFDISVWQTFVALGLGGRTEVLRDEVAQGPRALLDAIDRLGITVLEIVPSMLRAVVEEIASGGKPRLGSLRWMVATGEALPPDLCGEWLALYPHIPVVNAYGPTECSDDVTHHFLSAAPSRPVTPIGRPILNTQAYVLD
ncbi:MAG TPA: condensation domain-containing protein, partial [Myxococcales bacterium]|nr:condensation domain-containing protein [Myxococcales bacterium]